MIISEAVRSLSLYTFYNSSTRLWRSVVCSLLCLIIVSSSTVNAAKDVATIDLSQLEPIHIGAKLVGTMDRQHITESSGLVDSVLHDGVLWTLNDSGNSATIYPVSLNGALLSSSQSSGIKIDGAENFDWESITSDKQGTLYIADTGQNIDLARTQIIYQIKEPADIQATRRESVVREIAFNYEDQSGFFMSRNEFDVEAVFYSDHHIHLLTKGWGKSISKWYRLQQSEEFGNAARLLTRINFGKALITGAEVDQSGLRLAVLAKRSIWLFTREALGQNWFSSDIKYLRTRDIGVTEGITFYGNRLYISNESGQLYTIELKDLD